MACHSSAFELKSCSTSAWKERLSMRKPLIIAGSIVGVLVLVVVAIFIYAAANLNSLIAQNRDFIVQRVSSSLGRRVEIGEIKAHLGWGVSADVSDLKIADDPAFSSQPFVTAANVSAKVALLPLLGRELRVSKVVLEQPDIHIIRNADGELNVSTIGKKRAGTDQTGRNEVRRPEGLKLTSQLTEEAQTPQKREALRALEVHNFSISQGKVE